MQRNYGVEGVWVDKKCFYPLFIEFLREKVEKIIVFGIKKLSNLFCRFLQEKCETSVKLMAFDSTMNVLPRGITSNDGFFILNGF